MILKFDKNYNLKLIKPWDNKEYNIVIKMITDYKTLEKLELKIKMEEEFFKDTGLATFLEFTYNTSIFICAPIISLDPPSYEEDSKNFIPLSEKMINPSSISELIKVYKYSYGMSGIKYYSSDNINMENYGSTLLNSIKKSDENNEELIGQDYSTSLSNTEFLMKKTEYDSFDSTVKEKVKTYRENIDIALAAEEKRLSNIRVKENEFRDKEKQIADNLKETASIREKISDELAKIETLRDNYDTRKTSLDSTFDDLKKVYTGLKSADPDNDKYVIALRDSTDLDDFLKKI